MQLNLTKIFYIRTLFKVWLMQDFGLFRVQSSQVSLYIKLLNKNNRTNLYPGSNFSNVFWGGVDCKAQGK